MNAKEIKLALAMAQDHSIDLSGYDDSILFGFGLPDFVPVVVPLGAVARVMRWQSACLDGSWDWKQFNEDLPSYRKRVRVSDVGRPELEAVITEAARLLLSKAA